MRLISAGVGAPPPSTARSRGNKGVSPWRRCASKYARKKGTALPSRVAPCAAMRSGVVAGSKASNSTAARVPAINDAVSMAIPPMWETGIATGFTSSAVMPRGLEHSRGAVHHRAVGVADALRVGGRARRRVDPAHRRFVVTRGRSERGRITLGEAERVADRRGVGVEVGDDHREALVGGEVAGQRAVVEPAPAFGGDHHLGTHLAGDEADLALAQDRDEGILHRAEPRQRDHHDHRLERRR